MDKKYHYEGKCLVHKNNTAERQKYIFQIYYVDSDGNGKDKCILKIGVLMLPKDNPPKCDMTILECEDNALFANYYLIRFVANILESQCTWALNNDPLVSRNYTSEEMDLSNATFIDNVGIEYHKISEINLAKEKKTLVN